VGRRDGEGRRSCRPHSLGAAAASGNCANLTICSALSARVLEIDPAGRAGADLWTTGLDLGPGHVGAVATTGRAPVLRVAELPATLAAR
jgi:hypothetical protein